jgi:hypothetical protein
MLVYRVVQGCSIIATKKTKETINNCKVETGNYIDGN